MSLERRLHGRCVQAIIVKGQPSDLLYASGVVILVEANSWLSVIPVQRMLPLPTRRPERFPDWLEEGIGGNFLESFAWKSLGRVEMYRFHMWFGVQVWGTRYLQTTHGGGSRRFQDETILNDG